MLTLLEFARDMDRNADDNAFDRNKGVIRYVFDYNVFDAFIAPLRRQAYFQVFHAEQWSRDTSHPRRELSPYINGQLGIVATEYLAFGKLPGQQNGEIYLTHGHFMELQRPIKEIQQQRDDPAGDERERPPEPAASADRATVDAHMNALLEADVAAFKQPRERLTRYIEARTTAQKLLSDDPALAIPQINRLTTEIGPRLVPLSGLDPLQPEDTEAIERDARVWERRFDEELARRGGRGPERSRAALRIDAISLALILRIAHAKTRVAGDAGDEDAGSAPRDERIVFVTGDSIIFNAYRRWHADQAGGLPFVLRRLKQYSPIINLNDADSDVSGHRELFEQTRIATEAALFLFNLRPDAAERPPDQRVSSGRDDLAVRLTDLVEGHVGGGYEPAGSRSEDLGIEFFAPKLRDWLLNHSGQISELGARWQSLERFSVGVNYPQVMRRGMATAPAIAAVAARKGGLASVYLTYIESSLKDLVVSNLRMVMPFVTMYLAAAAKAPELQDGGEMRVPLALRLLVPNGGHGEYSAEHDVASLFKDLREAAPKTLAILDTTKNSRLAERPQLVYALAAALALRTGHWPEAERYAELAMPASMPARQRSKQPSTDPSTSGRTSLEETMDYECLYLTAVAMRFRMGTRSPMRWQGREDVWFQALNNCVRALDCCESHHAGRGELARELRAVSERAAVRLFYAIWFAVTPPEQRHTCAITPSSAIREFRLALDDLRKCLGLDTAARSLVQNDPFRLRSFEITERHYILNIAAAQVLGSMLTSSTCKEVRGFLPEELAVITPRLLARCSSGPTPESATSLEQLFVQSFLHLGETSPRFEPVERSTQSHLPLDTEFRRAIVAYFRSLPA